MVCTSFFNVSVGSFVKAAPHSSHLLALYLSSIAATAELGLSAKTRAMEGCFRIVAHFVLNTDLWGLKGTEWSS